MTNVAMAASVAIIPKELSGWCVWLCGCLTVNAIATAIAYQRGKYLRWICIRLARLLDAEL